MDRRNEYWRWSRPPIERNGEFCVTVGPVIWTAGILAYMRVDNRLSIARFMHESISLRDMVGRYGNLSLLSEDENYLATY